MLLSCGTDKLIKLWDVATAECVHICIYTHRYMHMYLDLDLDLYIYIFMVQRPRTIPHE